VQPFGIEVFTHDALAEWRDHHHFAARHGVIGNSSASFDHDRVGNLCRVTEYSGEAFER